MLGELSALFGICRASSSITSSLIEGEIAQKKTRFGHAGVNERRYGIWEYGTGLAGILNSFEVTELMCGLPSPSIART